MSTFMVSIGQRLIAFFFNHATLYVIKLSSEEM